MAKHKNWHGADIKRLLKKKIKAAKKKNAVV
jgi:lambda repressor-like predicted transcriptional regulator